MAKRSIEYAEISYEISYEILNPKNEKKCVILHGWGADKNIMKQAFSNEFSDFCVVFIDLPGFGNSSIQKPLNTYEYAKIIEIFLKEINFEAGIIIGHSFGGKIATLLKPINLILLSSAGIVHEKSLKVKCKIKLFKFLKALGLGGFYKLFASKDVENMNEIMYETFKNVVDESFDEEFKNFNQNAIIFWGKEDTATPLKSGQIIHDYIKKSKFYPLDGDHFFFLKHARFIYEKTKENLC